MAQTQARIVTATDTLIIRGVQHGRTWTWETEQKARTFADIQELIDGLVDTTSDVLTVWRVETNEHGHPIIVDDISEMFDLRTSDEIAENSKRVRELAFEAPAVSMAHMTTYRVENGRVA